MSGPHVPPPNRLRVPPPSLLVVAGLFVGLVPEAPADHVLPAVVSLLVLPPLLYAAGGELSWRDLRAVWRPVVHGCRQAWCSSGHAGRTWPG